MAEKGENRREFSSGLEDIPFAEMMQMMMGQKRAGSFCAEMMKKAGERKGGDRSFSCAEMMREMILLDGYQVWFFAQVSARHSAPIDLKARPPWQESAAPIAGD